MEDVINSPEMSQLRSAHASQRNNMLGQQHMQLKAFQSQQPELATPEYLQNINAFFQKQMQELGTTQRAKEEAMVLSLLQKMARK